MINSCCSKVKDKYKKLKYQCSCVGKKATYFTFLHFLYYKMKYCIDVEEYTINKLFDKTVSHEDFYKKNHKSIHSWKRVKEQYCEGMGAFRILYYRIDYLISKLIYPGLDAMDYFRYEFYNIRHSKRKTFITEGALKKLNKRFNNEKENYESFLILQDKVKFNDYFEQYIGREWISVENESRETFFNFIRKHKKVICKPQNGTQGHGIEICYPKSDGDIEELYDRISPNGYIVEEVLIQHRDLARLCKESVNTIRVYSVISREGKVIITGAVLRLGSGYSDTDNYSSGGYAATIDEDTGVVVSRAVNQNGKSYYVHPKSRNVIIGTRIPYWNKILECVVSAHSLIPDLRYIGWDVVVCQDGTIVLLEGNTYSGVALQQHPLLTGKKELYKSLI